MRRAPSSTDSGSPRADAQWDAIVVGAGPGGAITACSLARRGLSVMLLERQRFPRWKVCGACLSPGAIAALESAGVREALDHTGAKTLNRLSLAAGPRRATVPLRGSLALSRAVLDEALVGTAVSAGAVFREGCHATLGALAGKTRLVHVERAEEVHAALVVIDATGLGGRLRARRSAPSGEGAASQHVTSSRSKVGIGATLDDAAYPLSDGELRMVVGAIGYVGLVRVEDGRLNLGAAVDPAALKRMAPAEAVASILSEAGQPTLRSDPAFHWRGTPPLTQRHRSVGAERLLRLGDAAGYVEPFTGEGMCWAIDSGLAAAELVLRNLDDWSPRVLEDWRAYQRRTLARAQRLCRGLSWALRYPTLVRGAVSLLSVAPLVAAPFVTAAAARPGDALAGAV